MTRLSQLRAASKVCGDHDEFLTSGGSQAAKMNNERRKFVVRRVKIRFGYLRKSRKPLDQRVNWGVSTKLILADPRDGNVPVELERRTQLALGESKAKSQFPNPLRDGRLGLPARSRFR